MKYLILFFLVACEPRPPQEKFRDDIEVVFSRHYDERYGVVCYESNARISCVKVRP
jgi:hypothetical protein